MGSHVKLKLRVLVVGCTPLARRAIDIVEGMAELVGVVNLDTASGAAKVRYDTFSDFVRRRPDDIFWTADVNNEQTRAWMAGRVPDVILQCGWSQIFSADVLRIPKRYCIGVHPSPLPIGRGAAVLNWAIIEGHREWGNSLFVMEEKTDFGDILDFEPFMIESRDTARTAYLKADHTTGIMLQRTLPRIADGTVARTPQDPQKVTRYHKRSIEDGRMDFSWSAERCLRFVRALTDPFPGAFFETAHGRLIVWQAEEGPVREGAVGTLLARESGHGVLLQLGGGTTLWLIRVTPPGEVECWGDTLGFSLAESLTSGDKIVMLPPIV